MAIKRTIGRSKFVQPSGIVVDSGGQAMAQASQNIANAVTNITQNIDKNQLETAIIEAEKQGKQVGSRSVNGVPVPLDQMSLNSFTADIFNQSNLRKAQSYFKKQAINSYGLAIQNDAIKNASSSLQNNLGSVGDNGELVVKTASEGYLNSIKGSISNEVWNEIGPRLNKIWGDATRKASAYLVDNTRKVNINNAKEILENTLTEEANLIVNGTPDPLNYEYIETTKQKAFQLIKDNSQNDIDASNTQSIYSTKLQSLVSTNAVGMAHASGINDADLFTMAKTTSDLFKNDPNIDNEAVYKSMVNEISRLDVIDNRNKKTINETSTVSANEILLNINKNVYPSTEEIALLKPEHQLRVLKEISSQQKLINTNNVKIFNDNVIKRISAITNDNFSIVEQAGTDDDADFTEDDLKWIKDRKKMSMVQELAGIIAHKDLNPSTVTKIYKLTNAIADEHAKTSSDIFKANMTLAMSGNGKTYLDPNHLRSEKYVNKLVENNLVGTESFHAYTRDQWHNAVNKYEVEVKKVNKKASVLSQVANYVKYNIPLNKEMKIALDNEISPTFLYKGEQVPYDVLNENEEIREASIKVNTSLALSTGHVPTQLKDIFNSIINLGDENFSKAKIAYFSLKEEFYKKNGDGADALWEEFTAKNDLNTQLLDSSFFEVDASRFASLNRNISSNRNINAMFPHLEESGLTDKDIVVDRIKEVLEISDNNMVQRWFASDIDGNQTENKVVRDWLEQQGYGNFSEAIIGNPEIINQIIKGVKYRALTHKLNMNEPEKALLSAVKSEFYNMTGNLSLHKDRFGDVHLINGVSALRHAQSQIPGESYIMKKEDLIADALSQYNKTFGGGSQNQAIQDAIKNNDIMFIPNNEVVGDKTFRVVAFGNDGTNETLAENYSWSWEDSLVNKDYEEALNKISDGGVRKLLSSFNFMSKNNLEATMESIKSNREQAETWIGIVNTYNKIALGFNNFPTSPSNMLPIIDYVKSDKGKKELEDYFDNKRFLRFDLR